MRACEAACARETMLFPWLGGGETSAWRPLRRHGRPEPIDVANPLADEFNGILGHNEA